MKALDKSISSISLQEEHLINAMQALGDKTRFKMFKIMQTNKQMCVSEIAQELGISVPAVSQNFRIMELVGLVDKQRFGQRMCYQLKPNDPLIKKLVKIT